MEHCSILVTNGLFVDIVDGVREDYALAVNGNRIVEVGSSSDLSSRYRADCTIDASSKIVLPGLTNAHTHASATLFRGYASDVSGEGFFKRMWAIEALLSDEDVYIGALGGCLEMIKSGITCFANHFSHMDQVARAVQETGIRAGLSRTMLDHGDQSKAEDEVLRGVEFVERWNNRCSRILPMLGPHAAYTCSDELLKRAAMQARRLEMIIHLHIAESPHELKLMEQRTKSTTVEHLNRLGFFEGNRILAAHALLLSERDVEIIKRNDFHAVICATGKMNRGQGIADLHRLRDAGVNICLGTDGSASDNLDLLMGMKVTYIAQNYLHKRVSAIDPNIILEMATINPSKILPWSMGRLAPDHLADFILISRDRPHLCPMISVPRSNVVFNLVYYATGNDVDSVVIDGKLVMKERKVLTIDERQVLSRVQKHAQRLWDHASLGACTDS